MISRIEHVAEHVAREVGLGEDRRLVAGIGARVAAIPAAWAVHSTVSSASVFVRTFSSAPLGSSSTHWSAVCPSLPRASLATHARTCADFTAATFANTAFSFATQATCCLVSGAAPRFRCETVSLPRPST